MRIAHFAEIPLLICTGSFSEAYMPTLWLFTLEYFSAHFLEIGIFSYRTKVLMNLALIRYFYLIYCVYFDVDN